MGNWQPSVESRKLAWGALALASLVFLIVLVAPAGAWRRPSFSERRAVATAASRVSHAGGSNMHVSEIRLSTVGPWASATVTIYFGKLPDSAVDILHRVRGVWKNVGLGTAGEWCVMPPGDQRNLGFPSSYQCS
jgi:hypothetical protein